MARAEVNANIVPRRSPQSPPFFLIADFAAFKSSRSELPDALLQKLFSTRTGNALAEKFLFQREQFSNGQQRRQFLHTSCNLFPDPSE